MANNVIITNRKAHRDYTILETFEAGIELQGSEVKSLRERRANLKDSFARVDGREVFLYKLHITPYEYAASTDVDPTRPRRLLLHKSQIRRLKGEASQKGLTLIPLKLYFKKSYVKVELAFAKGKRSYDKREAIKRKETDRSIRRIMRSKRK